MSPVSACVWLPVWTIFCKSGNPTSTSDHCACHGMLLLEYSPVTRTAAYLQRFLRGHLLAPLFVDSKRAQRLRRSQCREHTASAGGRPLGLGRTHARLAHHRSNKAHLTPPPSLQREREDLTEWQRADLLSDSVLEMFFYLALPSLPFEKINQINKKKS